MTDDPADPDDVAAVAALDPPPTSLRDAQKRLRWRTKRAAAALRAYRQQRFPGASEAVPGASAQAAGDEPAPVAEPAAAGELAEPAPPAAASPPAPAGGLRDALDVALAAGGHGPEHAAAVELARRYADQLDADPDALGKLGRPLLAALVELRLTPRTRTALVPPTPTGGPGDPEDDERVDELERFRSRRDRRAYGTATVDPAAP